MMIQAANTCEIAVVCMCVCNMQKKLSFLMFKLEASALVKLQAAGLHPAEQLQLLHRSPQQQQQGSGSGSGSGAAGEPK